MAMFKCFSDVTGEALQLAGVSSMPNDEFASRWPGLRGVRFDGYQMRVGRSEAGELLPVTRVIEYKTRPSLHACSAKCLNGRHDGTCECRCGGRNHGAGMFTLLQGTSGGACLA